MITVGFAMCGSFCTFSQVIPQLRLLCESGVDVIPIMSENAYSLDTRFGRAQEFAAQLESATGKPVMHTLAEVEPFGPKKSLDILVIAPCTGNTLAKLALGIADSSVSFAAKAHLRNSRPLLIGVSTNDALSAAAKNIGALHNTKNVYFIPYRQDDSEGKPNSLVSDFSMLIPSLECALEGRQLQPVLCK